MRALDPCVERLSKLDELQCPSYRYHGGANISEESRRPMQGGSIRTKAGQAD